MDYIIAALAGYLFGCFPSAFLIVKKYSGKNVFLTGTRSSGAANSFEITRRYQIAVLVCGLDMLKAIIPYFLLIKFGIDSQAALASLVFAVLGHSYNAFLKFKGGRGLATSAGCSAAVMPSAVAAWGLMWVALFFITKRRMHISNAIATLATVLMVWIFPETIIKYGKDALPNVCMQATWTLIGIIIISRHIKPIFSPEAA